MKPPDAKKDHQLEVVYRLESLVASFTQFSSTVLHFPTPDCEQIVIATPYHEKMHQPRLWVLNATANDLQESLVIETGRSVDSKDNKGIDKKGPLPIPKAQPKKQGAGA